MLNTVNDYLAARDAETMGPIYRLLGNFVRAGRINKLILLHGPNGSAKSTIVVVPPCSSV